MEKLVITDEDLDAAVRAGVITRPTAWALRGHVKASRSQFLGADEESFRLISGFNDVFVAIACLLVLIPVAWFGASAAASTLGEPSSWAFGGLAVSAVAWLLAEVFVRKRRMALPAILLALVFIVGVQITVGVALSRWAGVAAASPNSRSTWMMWPWVIVVAIAAALHWKRFQVPITIAAGVLTLVSAIVVQVGSGGAMGQAELIAMFVCGLAVFAAAMVWDAADPQRRTHRADVAFWLHVAAAPLIVHPVFWWLGSGALGGGAGRALLVVLLYAALAFVSLIVDRRALMVSALGYVLYALVAAMKGASGFGMAIPLVALVVGSALLLLSAFWAQARARLVPWLPVAMQRQLPVAHARSV